MSTLVKSVLLDSMPFIRYGFGSKADPASQDVFPDWAERKPLWKQVHGTLLVQVTRPGQDCGEVDGLWTAVNNQPIGVMTADCVPILLVSADRTMVAALHAGWRGTVAGIVEAAALTWKKQGFDLNRCSAVLGPAARACCYEVGEDLVAQFKQTFSDKLGQERVREWNPSPRRLDIQTVNALELQRLGVGAVESIEVCTICNDAFASYRRDKDQSRQYSIIALKA